MIERGKLSSAQFDPFVTGIIFTKEFNFVFCLVLTTRGIISLYGLGSVSCVD